MDSLIRFLDSIAPIPRGDRESLETLVYRRPVRKGAFHLREGETPSTLGLVRRGLFRYFYTHADGTEFTKGFFPEGTVIVAYSALLQGRASHFSIQALEDSELDLVDYSALQGRFLAAPWFKDASLAMVGKGFCVKEERERQLLLFSAEERYRSFLAAHPGLDRRVKLHLIASYLGIKPESLSRIRKKMGTLT